jgi:hypothetical protein
MNKFYKNELNLAVIGGNLERLKSLANEPTNPDNYSQIGTVINDYRETLNDIIADNFEAQAERAKTLLKDLGVSEKIYELITDLMYY